MSRSVFCMFQVVLLCIFSIGFSWLEPVSSGEPNDHMGMTGPSDLTSGNHSANHEVVRAFQTDQFSRKDLLKTYAKQAGDKTSDEVAVLKERIIELRNKGKLGFRKIVPCKSVESFGAYSPIEAGSPVRHITIYVEPENVSTLVSDGKYIINCSVEILLIGPDGKVRAGKKGAINRVSRSPVIDIYFKFQIKPTKLQPAPMAIKLVLRDRIKEQTASFTLRLNQKSKKDKSQKAI
jgi:hypothetical protein